ncbi:MAG TPA: phosphoribosylaminoimidazolesuccinocarboxamide synthase [Acidimicrobiales bacterium]|nr:phosphoribosylaminoimidazolesuccinocarboxamide synthase [Acidimicrobiales bacterium]
MHPLRSREHRREALLAVDGHGLHLVQRGEVHDTFDLGDHLLMVATDRVGINRVMLQDGIPDKGSIANGLSRLWFNRVKHICPNHQADTMEWPTALKHDRERLEPRSMLVRKARVIPIECTVRGYMTHKALEEFLEHGTVGGKPVSGALRSGRLPEPRLVPSRRDAGKRVPITVEQMANELGQDLTERLERTAIEVYDFAEHLARTRDVVIAQTTLRFGWIDDELRLIGDCLTPDSSSYWPAEARRDGTGPRRMGKGFLLDELTALGWDGSAPGPRIPGDVVARVRDHYLEAYARITGDRWHFTDAAYA